MRHEQPDSDYGKKGPGSQESARKRSKQNGCLHQLLFWNSVDEIEILCGLVCSVHSQDLAIRMLQEKTKPRIRISVLLPRKARNIDHYGPFIRIVRWISVDNDFVTLEYLSDMFRSYLLRVFDCSAVSMVPNRLPFRRLDWHTIALSSNHRHDRTAVRSLAEWKAFETSSSSRDMFTTTQTDEFEPFRSQLQRLSISRSYVLCSYRFSRNLWKLWEPIEASQLRYAS
jgi:hypothetical protein